ncbi:MAG: tetratricopeptide repeat protein [Pirellulales bacterium]
MKLLTKLFGRKPDAAPAADCPTLDDAQVEELVRVYDSYGREHAITRQEWRDKVLLENLAAAQDDPDRLYDLIASALHDGFVAEVVPHAEQLRRIEPSSSRTATLLGVIYLQLHRLDEAEQVLSEQLRQGEESYLLTNLAKVYAERGQASRADATLWRALQLEPNQENGVAWYLSLAQARGGERAVEQGLRALAALPGSWRARLWLARAALQRNDLNEALQLYDDALEMAAAPLPAELLMQISGDLGNHGHLVELLQRVAHRFVATEHGLEVGVNLIKANVDLGRLDHAAALLNQLFALQRPDYQQALAYWDAEIAAARIRAGSTEPRPELSLAMLRIPCPLWLDRDAAEALLLPTKDENAVVVGFLGASADKGATGSARQQMADAEGRLTRALSLFLGEQLQLCTDGVSFVMQPIVPGHGGGLVVSGQAWSAEMAAEHAREGRQVADYVVVTHLDAREKTPVLSLRLIRTIDATVLESCETLIDIAQPEQAFAELAERSLDALRRRAGVDLVEPPGFYRVPIAGDFGDYQLRLEQLLAATACELDGARPDFLNGQREMVQGSLDLCLRQPDNTTPRLVLMSLLARLQVIHPQVVREFRGRVEMLQREHPLPQPVQQLVDDRLARIG